MTKKRPCFTMMPTRIAEDVDLLTFPDIVTAKRACEELHIPFFFMAPADFRKMPKTCWWFENGTWTEKTEAQLHADGNTVDFGTSVCPECFN